MNERIRELYYECQDESQSTEQCYQKFAELIVRECSLVIRNGGYRKGAFGNEDLRPSEIATMIEEHFGVEE
jgi:hypothetical protein